MSRQPLEPLTPAEDREADRIMREHLELRVPSDNEEARPRAQFRRRFGGCLALVVLVLIAWWLW